MRRTGRQIVANAGTTRRESAQQNNAALWQRVVDNNAEELLWVAEVLAGSRQAGEHWLAEAMALAEEAQYVAPEWMLSWVKRLLVHVALKQISSEIRQLIPSGEARSATPPARIGGSVVDRQQLRFVSPLRITGSFDALERACFILYGYLEYPMLDCVLLLGCPRGWIEAMCQRALAKVTAIGQLNQDEMPEMTFFISPGVTECAG
jgi:DNA-directed RNA polymerase specialized sigma24 family protein